MTNLNELEREVVELAVKWRLAKYAVAEAILWQDLRHAIDRVIHERRKWERQQIDGNN